jgi:hypothetical protein
MGKFGLPPALALCALMAGCAAEPPYFGPAGPDHPTGYTDQQIDQNRFRVSYQGNSQTPRTTVENFLLLRAAQVALKAGFPYFEFDTRDTKTKTTYFSSFTGWPGWGGYGRYGWNAWGGGPPFADDSTTNPNHALRSLCRDHPPDRSPGAWRSACARCELGGRPSRAARGTAAKRLTNHNSML